MDRVFAVRLRWGLRHPLTWLWGVLFVGAGVWWHNMPARAELCQWQHLVFWGALALGLLWSEIEIRPLDGWIKKYPAPVLLLLAAGAFAQMEASIENPFDSMILPGFVWGIVIALCIYLIFYALFGRVWAAGIAGSVVFLIWSLGSYYTLLFRGLPLMPNDLFSAGTAAEVLGAYQLTVTPSVLLLLLLFVVELAISLALRRRADRSRWKLRLAGRLSSLAFSCVWLCVCCTGAVAEAIGFVMNEWDWHATYWQQGYLESTLLKIEKLRYITPPGYSEDEMYTMLDEMEPASSESATPDIVLIVNESWFDWRQAVDFTANREITPFLDQLDNCVRGYAVSPQYESGTSHSEYELLTSNCTVLLPSQTPFTQRNLDGTNSLVKHLGDLGYSSISFHPASPSNYNRSLVYRQLGFEQSQFWNWEDIPLLPLEDVVYVHNGFSDESCFEWIRRAYEDRDTSRPAFIYNLTYQNHGGYEQADFNGGSWEVDPEHRVTLSSGFEAQRGQAEEYLSSVTYTDTAFQGLVEYFEQQEDPVIVCMVGDHAPHFTEAVETRYDGLEHQLHERGTPFVIWANYPLEEQEVGYIGMSQLAPLLLQTAGVELSPYYQSILELSEEFPVISRDFCQAADGSLASFSLDNAVDISQSVRRYIFFENAALTVPADNVADVFLPWNAA